ncbi:Leishmanolysin-like peptidase 2 [Plecturocebus cupreus]
MDGNNQYQPFQKHTKRVSLCHPGWSAVAGSWFTATSASWVKQFSSLSLLKTGFHHIAQAGLDFLDSSNLSTLASQSADITDGVSLSARLQCSGESPLTATSAFWFHGILLPQTLKVSRSVAQAEVCVVALSRLPATSASWVQTGFHYVGQAGLELPTSESHSLTLLPRLEGNGMIMAQCTLDLSESQVTY